MPGTFALTSAYIGGDAHVVTVSGDLDVVAAPGLRAELARASSEGAGVDSVALAVLV